MFSRTRMSIVAWGYNVWNRLTEPPEYYRIVKGKTMKGYRFDRVIEAARQTESNNDWMKLRDLQTE